MNLVTHGNLAPAVVSVTPENQPRRSSQPAQRSKLAAGVGISMLAGTTLLTACGSAKAGPNSPSLSSSPIRAHQETQEFGAKAFQALVNGEVPAGEHIVIRIGEKVLAICHIPSDNTTPSSIRKGGYYEIPSPESRGDIHKGQTLVTAANTFINLGPTSTHDPNVPECDPAQDKAVGYVPNAANAISTGASVNH